MTNVKKRTRYITYVGLLIAALVVAAVSLSIYLLNPPLHSSTKYVILTFDDGCPCKDGDQAANIMAEYGYVGVLFTQAQALEWLGTPRHATLLSNGWELGGHSNTHPYLNNLTQSQLQYELVDSVSFLEKTFAVEIISFGYPHSVGSDNETILSYLRQAGILYGREHMVHKNWNGSRSLQINSYSMDHANDLYLSRVPKLIADAKKYGIAVAMFHGVNTALSGYGAVTPTEFRWILDQIKANELVPITFKQLDQMNNTPK